jgi:hypothetical protein
MKKRLLLLLLLASTVQAFACSFPTDSFCRTLEKFSDRDIFTGEIIASDEDGITVVVLDRIRGTGIPDTVRIWDGTDFECNGIFSLAAALIGEEGETYVLMADKITVIENDWDVIGDYRWVDPYRYTPKLKLEGELVKGFIRGLSGAPPEYILNEMTYDRLRDELIASGNCANLVSTEEAASLKKDIIIPTPFSDYLDVILPEGLSYNYLRLYSLQGQLLREERWTKGVAEGSPRLATYDLANGVYLLAAGYNNTEVMMKKVVKVE